MVSYEQFTGANIDNLKKEDFGCGSEDKYEKGLCNSFFVFIYDFYKKYQNMSIDYVSKNLDKDIEKLRKDLINFIKKDGGSFIKTFVKDHLKEHGVKHSFDKVPLNYNIDNIKSIVLDTLENNIWNLLNKIKVKINVFKDVSKKSIDFNIKSNVKEFVNQSKTLIRYFVRTVKLKIHKAVLKFKYVPQTRYKWTPSFRNTCQWCIDNYNMEPKLLDEWDEDHINGECRLKPVNGIFTEIFNKFI